MPFVLESTTTTVASTEEFFLSCLINVSANPNTSTARRLRVKLTVDAVEIPVKSASWSQGNDTGNLTIELARLSDRSAFTRTAEIKFEVEEYLAGVWTNIKTYCEGALLSTSEYRLENNDDQPNDSFSITILPVLQQKLDLTPTQTVVLYDPDKVTVNEEEIEVIPNMDGTTTGTITVTPIASMNLGDIFDFIADTFGCVGYKTNINYEPWVLSRVDFPAAQSYWSTVSGIIGNHEPKIHIDADNYLVIRDGTLTDYVSARQMGLSRWKGITLNKNIERFKGCKLDRQMRANGWDYYELRKEDETQYFGGVSGQYPKTEITTWYQDFYRNSFPNTPVNTQIFSVRQLEYANASTVISATAERFSYTFGQGGIRLTRREAKEWGFSKAPQAWVSYQTSLAGPFSEFAGSYTGAEDGYTSASDDTFTESFVLTKAERTNYSYFPMYGVSDENYTGQTDTEQKGLITIDSENQMLGEDFEQPIGVAQESGNLAEGQGSRWGVTDRRKESQKPEKKSRRVNLRTRRHSALNSTSGMIAENYHDRRIGDIGDSDIKTETKPVYITENGDATASLWRNVNGGEAPLVVLQPLCHRLNKKQDFPGGVQGDLPTYDETIEIGTVIDPRVDGRANSSIGIFEVTSYTDTFEADGYRTAVTMRQIG